MMTENTLLEFIQENGCETLWEDQKCLIWIDTIDLIEFINLIKNHFDGTNRVKGYFNWDNICIDLVPIFEDWIDLEEIIPKA